VFQELFYYLVETKTVSSFEVFEAV